MGWVWSDELAATLGESPEIAPLIPPSWRTQPCAFAAVGDEDAAAIGRRLLGLAPRDRTQPLLCTCGGANRDPAGASVG